MQFHFSLHVIFVAILYLSGNAYSLGGSKLSDLKTCGILKEVVGDRRTSVPWTTSVFVRKTAISPLKFFTVGAVIGPSLILVVAENKNSSLRRPIFRRVDYKIDFPHSDQIIVATGLNNFKENETDANSQFREVSYIEPFFGIQPERRLFHLILLHLKVPLDLSTQYARSLCVPVKPNTQKEFMLASSVFREYFNALFQGQSYNLRVDPYGRYLSTSSNLNLWNKKNCAKLFQSYYNRELPVGLYCVKKTSDDQICLKQGQPISLKILDSRWLLLGLVTLIPETQNFACNSETVYFAYVPTFPELLWIRSQMNCKVNEFSCGNGACVPTESVCDQIDDCFDGADENKLLCNVGNTFRRNSYEKLYHSTAQSYPFHKTSVTESSFSANLINTSTRHKPTLLFVNNTVTRAPATTTTSQPKSTQTKNPLTNVFSSNINTCTGIPKLKGIHAECKHPETLKSIKCSERIPARTIATLSCEPLYKPMYDYPSIQILCQSSGKWRTTKQFSCESECNVVTEEDQEESEDINGSEDLAPWHGALYRIKDGFIYYLCGATLIEKRFLLTAAHCLNSHKVSGLRMELLKVVLSPVHVNYTASQMLQSKAYDVKEVWWPLSYDSKSLKSDIAVIQLHTPVKFTKRVRPACFMPYSKSDAIEVSPRGSVAGFGMKDNEQLFSSLKLAFFEMIPQDVCQRYIAGHDPTTICAAHSDGSKLCRGDSGGGLIFVERYKQGIRYTIKGVVSHRVQSKHVCDMSGPVVFTQVSDFKDWIVQVMKLASNMMH